MRRDHALHDAFKDALFNPAHLGVPERYGQRAAYLDPAACAAAARAVRRQREMIRRWNLRLD